MYPPINGRAGNRSGSTGNSSLNAAAGAGLSSYDEILLVVVRVELTMKRLMDDLKVNLLRDIDIDAAMTTFKQSVDELRVTTSFLTEETTSLKKQLEEASATVANLKRGVIAAQKEAAESFGRVR